MYVLLSSHSLIFQSDYKTPDIYAEGYILFIFPFVSSYVLFICLFKVTTVTLVEFVKVLVKVSH